ncbi:hypothetical protein CFC21_015793 [Triticum aestivum]|uniref:Peroxidase n=3 Tax=Triticum TaxID=4564 RepID=A0A9R1NM97_TRITD|nr:peroxidase 2-like [Triticum dicoccoides]XP_044452869.1 peroxidase 2-like [Triticum aestivum]KAF6999819.1 hypothetical protein CFC21_015793 [Triticum aestivum]VAH27443.1 unnamed protein product [Triticum turgidum subsp. durum]
MACSDKKIAFLALLLALLGCLGRTCQASYGFPYPLLPFFQVRISSHALSLTFGHYPKVKNTCYGVETIVRDIVKEEVDRDRGIGAGLIRLFFHDCFVRGCDASVLLNTTSTPNEPTEMEGIPNKGSLRGFEVINRIKEKLEATPGCKHIVSCSDIVAFAGRDATYFLSNKVIDFEIPSGRYDGRVSLASETLPNLPPPFANITMLEAMFQNKNLTLDEMVTLSGAHSIGISHCSSFNGDRPTTMNSTLADLVTANCSSGGNPTVDQDIYTPGYLDNQYYNNVLNHEVLFKSDAALESPSTIESVKRNARYPVEWEQKFRQAMVKMGNIEVKTSMNGEIRQKCWSINY